jgi:hypothetical protein
MTADDGTGAMVFNRDRSGVVTALARLAFSLVLELAAFFAAVVVPADPARADDKYALVVGVEK